MSLRILHTLRTVDAGAEKSIRDVIELSVAQRQFGHMIDIVTLDPSETDGLGDLGVPVHRLGNSLGAYGYNTEFVRWMEKHVREYDCVIIHGIWHFNSYGAWLALRDSNVPYFVFTHGMLDPWFKLTNPFNHFKRWLYWPWGGYPVLRDAHAVLFLCDYERHRSHEAFWLYDCHEFVVRYGVTGMPVQLGERAREEFLEQHPALAGKRLFTYFGDKSGRKGADCLIRAVALLLQKGSWKQDSMALVLANTNPGKKEILVRLAERLGLAPSIYWAGAVSGEASWAMLRASEVFLRPSDYEVSGRSVVNALSAGVPTLMSTGVCVWKDVVNDGAGLCDDETPEGFARLIGSWLSFSEDERAAMGRAARRSFEGRFTLDGAANTLTAAIYLMVGVHRDGRWDLKPLKPASELP